MKQAPVTSRSALSIIQLNSYIYFLETVITRDTGNRYTLCVFTQFWHPFDVS